MGYSSELDLKAASKYSGNEAIEGCETAGDNTGTEQSFGTFGNGIGIIGCGVGILSFIGPSGDAAGFTFATIFFFSA